MKPMIRNSIVAILVLFTAHVLSQPPSPPTNSEAAAMWINTNSPAQRFNLDDADWMPPGMLARMLAAMAHYETFDAYIQTNKAGHTLTNYGVTWGPGAYASTTIVATNAVHWSNATNDISGTPSEVWRRWAKDLYPESKTNLIHALAPDICAIYGHNWIGGRSGEPGFQIYADYHPNVSYRHCPVCGLGQSQTLEWK